MNMFHGIPTCVEISRYDDTFQPTLKSPLTMTAGLLLTSYVVKFAVNLL